MRVRCGDVGDDAVRVRLLGGGGEGARLAVDGGSDGGSDGGGGRFEPEAEAFRGSSSASRICSNSSYKTQREVLYNNCCQR